MIPHIHLYVKLVDGKSTPGMANFVQMITAVLMVLESGRPKSRLYIRMQSYVFLITCILH